MKTFFELIVETGQQNPQGAVVNQIETIINKMTQIDSARKSQSAAAYENMQKTGQVTPEYEKNKQAATRASIAECQPYMDEIRQILENYNMQIQGH